MASEYDIVVLGGGPAGYPAAIRAAQMGARAALIERDELGGTCLNRGCIPTKTLHAAAHLIEGVQGGRGRGIAGSVTIDPDALFDRKGKVVEELVSGVERLLKGRKVDLIRGEGRITGPRTIDVEGTGSVKGEHLIIATGSSEMSVPGIEFDGKRVLGSSELLDLGRIPESLVIIGGGVIGCEFASIFNAFGTKVTIIEMLPRIIATEDSQISRYLQTYLKKKGVAVHLGTKVLSTEEGDGYVTARLEDGTEMAAEYILISVGRRPNITGIGLEELGIEAERTGIKVDGAMRTGAGEVYAAGDVTGGWLLAHVATREGIIAAQNALGEACEIDYSSIPTTIYTLPEISRVGLSEDDAKEKGIEYSTGRFPFAANGKAKGLGEEDGFVKWLASKDDGSLLGLHIIGPQATELLTAGILAVGRGMKAADFAASIFPHPTLSESLMEAAEALEGKAIHLIK